MCPVLAAVALAHLLPTSTWVPIGHRINIIVPLDNNVNAGINFSKAMH
jgi:hypothetical protein